MFEINQPLESLKEELKDQLKNWGAEGRPILQYRFGFYRLPFYSDRLEDGFALHIWLESLPRDEHPHTHIFDLTSRVLMGSIENNIWDVRASPQGNYRLITPVCTNQSCSDVDSKTYCEARQIERKYVGTGETYSIPKSTFHTGKILTFPAITLVKRANVEPDAQPSHIIPRIQVGALSEFDFAVLDYKNAWVKVQSVLSAL